MKQVVSWMDLAQGQLKRSVDREMTKVVANIMDQNTEPEKKRKLTVTLTFQPNERRTDVKVTATVKSSLQPETETMTFVEVQRDDYTGELVCLELDGELPGQMDLLDGAADGLRVIEP